MFSGRIFKGTLNVPIEKGLQFPESICKVEFPGTKLKYIDDKTELGIFVEKTKAQFWGKAPVPASLQLIKNKSKIVDQEIGKSANEI